AAALPSVLPCAGEATTVRTLSLAAGIVEPAANMPEYHRPPASNGNNSNDTKTFLLMSSTPSEAAPPATASAPASTTGIGTLAITTLRTAASPRPLATPI